jgi:DNA-binding response OmpR family regulator
MTAKSNAAVGPAVGLTVCVIDDDEHVRVTVAQILRHAGYVVVEASDGDKGLEVVKNTNPDIVVTDIVMPNREGIETIRELRERFPDVRILAISGGGGTSYSAGFLEVARALGADDVLAKPFRTAELLHKLGKLAPARVAAG